MVGVLWDCMGESCLNDHPKINPCIYVLNVLYLDNKQIKDNKMLIRKNWIDTSKNWIDTSKITLSTQRYIDNSYSLVDTKEIAEMTISPSEFYINQLKKYLGKIYDYEKDCIIIHKETKHFGGEAYIHGNNDVKLLEEFQTCLFSPGVHIKFKSEELILLFNAVHRQYINDTQLRTV